MLGGEEQPENRHSKRCEHYKLIDQRPEHDSIPRSPEFWENLVQVHQPDLDPSSSSHFALILNAGSKYAIKAIIHCKGHEFNAVCSGGESSMLLMEIRAMDPKK